MNQRVVVIGASAAGLRAAARAKRLLPQAQITVIDAGKIISYGACGLPYYVAGDIQSLMPLRTTAWGVVRDADFFSKVKDLHVRTGTRVVAIDRQTRELQLAETGAAEGAAVEKLPYDQLVIATGAVPQLPAGISADHPRVTTFKSIEDAQRWRKVLQSGEIEAVAIIGGGYIGCELAEAFAATWGCEVDLIEKMDHVLPQILDPEMARLVEAHLLEHEVRLHTGGALQSIAIQDDQLEITTQRAVISTQQAIAAVGVRPNSGLAHKAGLEIGPLGGIAVDTQLRTSDPAIFAAGDCVELRHRVSEQTTLVPLGSLANRQGRVVGDALAGRPAHFGPVVGSGAVKVFDLNVACAGLTASAAVAAGIPAAAVWGTFSDKAHYYPEDKVICCKLLYAPQGGRLLGLQAVGPGEVVKRVDVFANLLHRGGNIDDLLDLEFAYAPPYAPAVDPLYVLGCAARSQLDGEVSSVAPDIDFDGYQVVDVRTQSELHNTPLNTAAALHIPLEQLRGRLAEIPRDRPILTVCARGARSAEATRILRQAGLTATVYLGGGAVLRLTGRPRT